jgi:hypothetical protein
MVTLPNFKIKKLLKLFQSNYEKKYKNKQQQNFKNIKVKRTLYRTR